MQIRRPARVDWFDLAVLAVFALVSVWVLGLDVWQVAVNGRHWAGTDGPFLTDQMQYLAWIQDASRHVLVSDLFVLHSTPHDYFQPLVVVSAGFTAAGLAPWLVFLLWKPVAVLITFFVVRAYVRRCLATRWQRRAALVLALFFGSWGVLGDLWLPFLSWGYPFALIAIAAMVGALLLYDRARVENRFSWGPPVLGALASSLHPWQGEVLILTVIAAEVLGYGRGGDAQRGWRSWTLPAATVFATGVPLAYLVILGRIDLAWRLARVASHHSYPLAPIALALAPLLLLAVLAYRSRPHGFIAVATRLWPAAALAVYGLSATGLSATPLHAFGGITIPLAILGVEGLRLVRWQRVPGHRALAVLVVAAFAIPATVYEMSVGRDYVSPAQANANFISSDMRRALDYLSDDREPGGVLTRAYLGVIVPGKTGRRTYIGGCQWSQPNCEGRVNGVKSLFTGSLTPPAADAFVLGTRARFVLEGCNWGNLDHTLAAITDSIHRFGCATVYEVGAPGHSDSSDRAGTASTP